jgi:hypothetical protein
VSDDEKVALEEKVGQFLVGHVSRVGRNLVDQPIGQALMELLRSHAAEAVAAEAVAAAVKTVTAGLREDLRQLSDACDGYIIELQRTAGVEKERDQLRAEVKRLTIALTQRNAIIEAHREAIEQARRKGAEEMRERAASLAAQNCWTGMATVIRSWPLDTPKERG